jgi:hypothetical protein
MGVVNQPEDLPYVRWWAPVFGLQASPLTSPTPLLIWASTNAYQSPINGVTIIWNAQTSTHKHEMLENRKRERERDYLNAITWTH